MENKTDTCNNLLLVDSSLAVFLDYEIRSSWWASLISWDWGQKLSGKYYAWKTSRKYARYKQSKVWKQRINRL
jgi:hypothetical protein